MLHSKRATFDKYRIMCFLINEAFFVQGGPSSVCFLNYR